MTKWFRKALIAIVLVLSMVLPILTPVANAAGQGSTGLKDYHSMTMDQILALNEDLTWVMTGDSITHNGSWTQGMNSYSEWFEQYLYMVGRGDDSVINTAWGGADIQDFQTYENTPDGNGAKADPGMGLEQFVTKYNPDVVTIKLGMNNRSMSDASFTKYYNMMLDSIYEAGEKNGKIPKIIIITPTPMSGETLINQDETDKDSCWRFQRILKDIAEERDLLFVDLQTAFTTAASQMGSDNYRATFYIDPSDGGIHPNAAGHYLIFKTLSKVLGIYDEDLALYQMDYEDLIYASLWTDSTSNVELSAGRAVDNAEMDKTMPDVSTTANQLAYVEFNASTGVFSSSDYSTADKVDLTDSSAVNDALTLSEVKSMGKEFTVVFRAKLQPSPKANQPVLFLSTGGSANWNNALALGVPGTSNQCYYEIRSGGSEKTTSTNSINMSGSNTTVGQWHTIAVVQSEDAFTYYIDGEAVYTTAIKVNENIGTIYAAATELYAVIGTYSENAASFLLNGELDFWALYDGALSATEISAMTVEAGSSTGSSSDDTADWSVAFAENSLWAVAGAEQMSGYEGLYVNRSLFRLLDNTIRNTGSSKTYHRDIRLLNVAAPGYTVSDMAAQLEAKDAAVGYDVLLLLPEVSQVYGENYTHSSTLVNEYKSAVMSLIAQNSDKTIILWTPLASNDSKINGYLNDYADAVRQIAAADSTILFWDANAFMNKNMESNGSLLNNWFDDDMHITPLAALDLARGFFTKAQSNGVSTAVLGELTTHNLRQSGDKRTYKGSIVRDNIAAGVSVSGTSISVDISAIVAAYPGLTNVKLAYVPTVGYGDRNDTIRYLNASVNGNVYTVEAPCTDPVIAVYGTANGVQYRFQDLAVTVKTNATIGSTVVPTDLTDLKVVGAPDISFSANTTTYNVNLYQYQRYVQIIGTAAKGQTITVNGEEVLSGERSQLIEVEDTATVTVKANGKTYTLKLTRPEYPDIIITEVMQASTGNLYDLIEIYNASGEELNLLDYSIGYKKDYTYSLAPDTNDQWPYYFAGNDTGFHSTSGDSATKTGINQITKYSSYGPDGSKTEPETVMVPAGGTMVIWVKYSKSTEISYETLLKYLNGNANTGNNDNKTMVLNGKAVVPAEQQLLVAEVPYEKSVSGMSASSTQTNFYLENHGAVDSDAGTRSWLFVLKDSAERHYHNAITAAGDDIISAALLSRVSTSDNLSTVLYYDVERGLSAVKNAGELLAAPVSGYTSDKSGYMNLTTFGAIEHWQKPYDLSDTTAPTVTTVTNGSSIELTFKDNSDVRYMKLYADKDGDGVYDSIITQDWVLEESAANAWGIAAAAAKRTYTVSGMTGDAQYYGYVLDGNNNKTYFGNDTDAIESEITGSTADATNTGNTTGGNVTGSGTVSGGEAGDATTGGDSSTGTTGGSTTGGNTSSGATEGTNGSAGGTSGGSNGTSGSNGSSGGDGSTSPATGNEALRQMLVTLIVLVSAAALAVMGIIGYKYKKING